MIVSNFEIGSEQGRRTEYQLQVTNLEDEDVVYSLTADFSLSTIRPVSVSGIADQVRGVHSFFQTGVVVRGRSTFVLQAGKTDFQIISTINIWNETLFGMVRLDGARRRARSAFLSDRFGDPVRVLLHARRCDYRSRDYGPVIDRDGFVRYQTELADDYSSESITISTGRAENELTPVPFRVDLTALSSRIENRKVGGGDDENAAGALLIAEDERALALVDLLAAVGIEMENAQENVTLVNDVLSEGGSRVRVSLSD